MRHIARLIIKAVAAIVMTGGLAFGMLGGVASAQSGDPGDGSGDGSGNGSGDGSTAGTTATTALPATTIAPAQTDSLPRTGGTSEPMVFALAGGTILVVLGARRFATGGFGLD